MSHEMIRRCTRRKTGGFHGSCDHRRSCRCSCIFRFVLFMQMKTGLLDTLEEQSNEKTLLYVSFLLEIDVQTISELLAIRDTMIKVGYNSYSMVDASQLNFVRYLIYNTSEEEEEKIEWDMPDANDIGDMDLSVLEK